VLNLLVAGLRFPHASAVLGATWVAGELVYRYVWVCAGGEGGREREAGGDVIDRWMPRHFKDTLGKASRTGIWH